MNELDYIEYVKDIAPVRMLLNPFYVRDLVDVDERFYTIIEEYYTESDLDDNVFFNDLHESPIAIDIDSNGDIIFLYTSNRQLGQRLRPFIDTSITYDVSYEYLRPSDLDQLITLREDYRRQ